MRYLVKIYRQGDDYSAMVPDLPGCVAAADSIEEVRALITRAIGLHRSMMRKNGERIPKPSKQYHLKLDELEEEELCTWVDVKAKQPA